MSNHLDGLMAELRSPIDILSGFLEGTKAGASGWVSAICPFHPDSSPSLSVNTTSGGWKCFACDKTGSYYQLPNNPGNPKPVQVYSYLDEETGALEYIKVRYYPKTFKVFTVAKSGELIAGKLTPKNLLYGWDKVRDERGPLYIVEGEKDADTLIKAGLRAVTPGGASQWDQRFCDLLSKEEVFLIPDNDEPGQKWAARITESLGTQIRGVYHLPADVKDISDWYSRGFVLDQLEASPVAPTLGDGGGGLVDLSRQGEPSPRPQIWGGLVPDNVVTVLYADGGVGKSLFMLHLAHHVALGKAFLGIPVSGLASVAFFDWELNLEEQVRRAFQVSRGLGLKAPPPGLWYKHPEQSLELCIKELKALVDQHKIRLAIVDSMGPACGGDTNNAQTVINFYQELLKLGIPVVVIDHQAKVSAESTDSSLKPYGSVYKWNLARSVLKLERRSADVSINVDYTLLQLKNNFGPLTPPTHFTTYYDRVSDSFEIKPRVVE